jgi:uncharacterized protein Usg
MGLPAIAGGRLSALSCFGCQHAEFSRKCFAMCLGWQWTVNFCGGTISVGRIRDRTCEDAMTTTREMELMLAGYGLTTAEILYRLPDHPVLIQSFVWQTYDLAPKFPALTRFLDFWKSSLDGPLHSVRYTHRQLISAGEWRNVTGELVLH